jgi:hypothetical protein
MMFCHFQRYKHTAAKLLMEMPKSDQEAILQVTSVNRLTPNCVPAGTKNSRLEDFLLAKHASHNKHSHHDEPFSRLAAWF